MEQEINKEDIFKICDEFRFELNDEMTAFWLQDAIKTKFNEHVCCVTPRTPDDSHISIDIGGEHLIYPDENADNRKPEIIGIETGPYLIGKLWQDYTDYVGN